MHYQKRVEMLKESDLYQCGEAFTTTQAAAVFGMTRVASTALLNRMAEEGHLIIMRTPNPSACPFKYSKPSPNFLRLPWRTTSNKKLRIKSRQFGVQT